MIVVTRLNSRRLVLNAELIKTIEETPDTVITLTNGDRVMVRESLEEVVRRAIEYSRSVRAFAPVPVSQAK
jgi:flagellar protein FlbD